MVNVIYKKMYVYIDLYIYKNMSLQDASQFARAYCIQGDWEGQCSWKDMSYESRNECIAYVDSDMTIILTLQTSK